MTPADYDATCQSGMCTCLQFSNASVSGMMAGSGTASGSVTTDDGLLVPPGPGSDGCSPFFGVVTLSTTLHRMPLTVKLDVNGTTCRHFPGTSPDFVNGGFGIVSATNGAIGWGNFTGTENKSGAPVNPGLAILHLKGSITE